MSKSLKEKLKQRREDISKKGGNYDYIIFKEGVHRLRILPCKNNEEFGVEVTLFFLGKDIGGVISPVTFGEKCAIMEAYQELKDGDEDDKTTAERLKPKKRYMVPAIKYKDEKGKEVDDQVGVKLALLTGGQYQDVIDFYLDEEKGDFSDPVNGYDIKFKRTGSGMMDTEYSTLDCKPTKLPKAYNKEVSPEEMVRELIPSYDETREKLSKFLNVDLDDDEDEAPKKKKKKSSSKTSSKKTSSKKKKKKGDL